MKHRHLNVFLRLLFQEILYVYMCFDLRYTKFQLNIVGIVTIVQVSTDPQKIGSTTQIKFRMTKGKG